MPNNKNVSDLLRTCIGYSILEEWGDRVKTREHYFSLRDDRDAEKMRIDHSTFLALGPTLQECENGEFFRRYRLIP